MAESEKEQQQEVFDIDALAEEYTPVRIKFRGKEYTLGASVLQTLAAADLLREGEGGTADIVRQLPVFLRTLCPDMAATLEEKELAGAEEVALLRPITAVMDRFSAITKSQEDTEE